jgi:hypothetical protein
MNALETRRYFQGLINSGEASPPSLHSKNVHSDSVHRDSRPGINPEVSTDFGDEATLPDTVDVHPTVDPITIQTNLPSNIGRLTPDLRQPANTSSVHSRPCTLGFVPCSTAPSEKVENVVATTAAQSTLTGQGDRNGFHRNVATVLNEENHWFVVWLNFEQNEVILFDSMQTNKDARLDIAQRWASEFLSSIGISHPVARCPNLCQQSDTYNCGIFAIVYAACCMLLRTSPSPPLTHPGASSPPPTHPHPTPSQLNTTS